MQYMLLGAVRREQLALVKGSDEGDGGGGGGDDSPEGGGREFLLEGAQHSEEGIPFLNPALGAGGSGGIGGVTVGALLRSSPWLTVLLPFQLTRPQGCLSVLRLSGIS